MMDPATPPDAARLQQPLARLLRPLVRLLIRSGVTFPALCDLLRELYVNVAEHDFALPGRGQTDSRVSLVTGIHRKEVSRLRGAGTPVSPTPVVVSRTSRIIARWIGGPPYSDKQGNAMPLPRAGEGASFDSLVASVTRDVRPRAVLDEWLDRRLVALDGEGRVALQQTAYLPQAGSDQQLYYFGRNIHDHMAAAVTNVMSDTPPFFERAVHYDGLSAAAARQLEERSRALAATAMQTANLAASQLCATEEADRWRWNFGVYIYVEPEDASRALPPGPARPPAGGDQ